MTTRIAVITDLHLADERIGERRGDWAHVLLLRAVHRLNRFIKPDVTIVLGDLINDPQKDAGRYAEIRDCLALLESPVIALPGNHDVAPAEFYDFMPAGQLCQDIAGCRFVSFIDEEQPGYNAKRSEEDIGRLQKARRDWHGPLVALQHVPIFPLGTTEMPYNYTNAQQVITAMKQAGVTLAISGHYHHGHDLFEHDGMKYIVAPALCESPFAFLEIELNSDSIEVTRHELRLPGQYHLVDRHIHSQFAYCGENITMEHTAELAEMFGLAGFGISEHGDQLYCSRETWMKKDHCIHGFKAFKEEEFRAEQYFALAKKVGIGRESLGLEIEMSQNGQPLLRPQDRDRCGFLIGAVHQLYELWNEKPDMACAEDEFLTQTQQLINLGVDILAHPFRVFGRRNLTVPERLYSPVVKMLRQSGVAAELNYHTNDPPIEFVKLCLDAGVKFALGSDTHNMYEVGELWPGLKLLAAAGYNGDFTDILVPEIKV